MENSYLKRWEYQTTLPASWETCLQVKKQQLEPDMEQRTGERQGCILSPCLFNLYEEYIMQNARLDEAQPGIKIARRSINNLKYINDTTFMKKWRGTKEPLGEGEREEWKSWLKTQHSKN